MTEKEDIKYIREKHKLKMEELSYIRETEKLKHEWELERGRIKSADIKRSIMLKRQEKGY